jgi:hypothetical protein
MPERESRKRKRKRRRRRGNVEESPKRCGGDPRIARVVAVT